MNDAFAAWWAVNLAGVRHFTPEEFLTKGGNANGLNTDPPETLWPNVIPLVRLLDELRDGLGVPITLNSVYRSPAYNASLDGAAASSQHVEFRAADIVIHGLGAPADWAATLRNLRTLGYFSGGVGVYQSFVHVDVRGYDANWGPQGGGRVLGNWPSAYDPNVDEPEVRRLQTMLNAAGYQAGNIDGHFGGMTFGALDRFRRDHGLPLHTSTIVTEADWAALARSEGAEVSEERANVDARGLAASGSRSIITANRGLAMTTLGGGGSAGAIIADMVEPGTDAVSAEAVAAAIESTQGAQGGGVIADLTEAVQPITDAINAVQPHVTTFQRIMGFVGDLWPYAAAAVFLIIAGLFVYHKWIRVDDQRTGRNVRPLVVKRRAAPPAAVAPDEEDL